MGHIHPFSCIFHSIATMWVYCKASHLSTRRSHINSSTSKVHPFGDGSPNPNHHFCREVATLGRGRSLFYLHYTSMFDGDVLLTVCKIPIIPIIQWNPNCSWLNRYFLMVVVVHQVKPEVIYICNEGQLWQSKKAKEGSLKMGPQTLTRNWWTMKQFTISR